MKKRIVIALEMSVLSLFVTACGGSHKATEEPVTSREEAVAEEPEEEKGEQVERRKGALTETPTLYESAWDRAYEHFVGNEFTGDLAKQFEELQDIDIDGDGLKDVVWFCADDGSEGNTSGIEIQFGSGDSVEVGGMQSAPNLDLIISFRDIDGNGQNEILAVSYIESTGGPIAMDVLLFRLEGEDWILYPLWDCENNVTYMCDEEGLIDVLIGDAYPCLRDAELTEDGVALLYDLGMKDGPMVYLDYFGVKGVLLEDEVEVIGAGKEIGTKYWPVDMDISTDEMN